MSILKTEIEPFRTGLVPAGLHVAGGTEIVGFNVNFHEALGISAFCIGVPPTVGRDARYLLPESVQIQV